MNPAELIDIQGRLAEGLAADQPLIEHTELLLSLIDDAFLTSSNAISPREVIEIEAHRLRGAATFHVSAEMTQVVLAAAEGLVNQDKPFSVGFTPETLPAEIGFVLLEPSEYLTVFHDSRTPIDEQEKKYSTRLAQMELSGFSWGPVRGHATPFGHIEEQLGPGEHAGVRLTFYAPLSRHAVWMQEMIERFVDSSKRKRADLRVWLAEAADALELTVDRLIEIAREANDNGGEVPVPEAYVEPNGQALFGLAVRNAADLLDIEEILGQDDGIRVRASKIGVDEQLRRYDHVPVLSMAFPRSATEISPDNVDIDGVNLLAMAWTFFHLCGQKIAAHEPRPAPRAAARRWKDLPLAKRVNVVRLRREAGPRDPDAHRDVRWTHRWMVSGHWRMQAYGPGRAERRPLWIHGFVKGPAGTPLVISEKVYDLVR